MRATSSWLALALVLAACGREAPAHQGVQPRVEEAESGEEPADSRALAVNLSASQRRRIRRLSPRPAAPPDPTNAYAEDERAADLGHRLFYDERLSGPGNVSCATCHDPERGFSDGKQLAETIAQGTRHTPTLIHVAQQRWFFWDGRADSAWAQALAPLENPIEMDGDRTAIAHTLRNDGQLRLEYEQVFGRLPDLSDPARFPAHARPMESAPEDPRAVAWGGMSAEDQRTITQIFVNVGKSIAAFERRLVSDDAPFDRFVRGLGATPDEDDPTLLSALSSSAQRGLELFIGRGNCTLCHLSPLFSDREFHNTAAPPLDGGELEDPGRYDGAKRVRESEFHAASEWSDEVDGEAARRVRTLKVDSESWGEFKTPTLRDLSGRGPYMHQGQFATLRDVATFYSTLEGAAGRNHHAEQVLLPLELEESELEDLVAFLQSLDGQGVHEAWCRPPQ